jgi:sialate O-acetylesterase
MNRQTNMAPGEDPQAFVVEADGLQGFEIRAADGSWTGALAQIVSPGTGGPDFVEVWSPDIGEPVAVRYGWANFPLCNLFNSYGLPASPFRSDRDPVE